jgi:hypothetical protein
MAYQGVWAGIRTPDGYEDFYAMIESGDVQTTENIFIKTMLNEI